MAPDSALKREEFLQRLVGLVPEPTAAPTLVGIDGRDGVGKTTLADELAPLLTARGINAHRASLDGFHHPRAHRYRRGRDSAEGYWLDAYDTEAIGRELLAPWRAGHGFWRDAIHDVVTDEMLDRTPRPVPPDGVLLVDGVFLARPELVEFWSMLVLLDAPLAVSQARGATRYGPGYAIGPGDAKYAKAHATYRAACDPAARADVVVDYSDVDEPAIIRG